MSKVNPAKADSLKLSSLRFLFNHVDIIGERFIIVFILSASFLESF
jgi:hypothetical protein